MGDDERITQITEGKKQYLDLLRLGDEQETMIDRYLDRGDMFVLQNGRGESVAVAVVVRIDDGTMELKNLAVAEEYQKKGYGRRMLDYVCRHYAGSCDFMLVGTGEVAATVGFYEHCGFVYSHRIKDFFTENYDHPIFENGVLLKDMVYFKRQLKKR